SPKVNNTYRIFLGSDRFAFVTIASTIADSGSRIASRLLESSSSRTSREIARHGSASSASAEQLIQQVLRSQLAPLLLVARPRNGNRARRLAGSDPLERRLRAEKCRRVFQLER